MHLGQYNVFIVTLMEVAMINQSDTTLPTATTGKVVRYALSTIVFAMLLISGLQAI